MLKPARNECLPRFPVLSPLQGGPKAAETQCSWSTPGKNTERDPENHGDMEATKTWLWNLKFRIWIWPKLSLWFQDSMLIFFLLHVSFSRKCMGQVGFSCRSAVTHFGILAVAGSSTKQGHQQKQLRCNACHSCKVLFLVFKTAIWNIHRCLRWLDHHLRLIHVNKKFPKRYDLEKM